MQEKIVRYFQTPVRVLAWTLPAWIWMLSAFAGLAALGIGGFTLGRVSVLPLSGPAFWVLISASGLLFVFLFLTLLRSLFRSLYQFTIFTLVLAAVSFYANSYILSHAVFPPMTARTTAALWISFAALAASVFRDRYAALSVLLQPLLLLGALISIAFIIVLAPFMTFSWFFVWAGGLGFLPYSPLFAFLSFVLSAAAVHRITPRKHLSLVLVLGTLTLGALYGIYYRIQWQRAVAVIETPATESGSDRLDADLPEWIRTAARLPLNHVTEMTLQPNRASEIALFNMQANFDPVAFLCSSGMSWIYRGTEHQTLSGADAGQMQHLLFGIPFAYLDRLWRGHSLITTDVRSRVQIYPDLRAAYTETTIAIYNDGDTSGRLLGMRVAPGAGPEEAVYTITLPPGSICTKLSLWVDGTERPARLTFKSTARRAYATIVGAERRDPSTVEWLDGNRLRLRVFPVEPGKYRTVKIGIVTPLEAQEGRLTYQRILLDGPVDDWADQEVEVDLFSTARGLDSSGIWLTEKKTASQAAASARQFAGHFARNQWTISLPAPQITGSIRAGQWSYAVSHMEMETVPCRPQALLLVLSDSISRSKWKSIVHSLLTSGVPVYLIANEWFHSQSEAQTMAYLEKCELPRFNLFPLDFPEKQSLGPVLWVVPGKDRSIPFSELRGSERFAATQRLKRTPDAVVVIGGNAGEYTSSLIDLGRLRPVGESEEDLARILSTGFIRVPVENAQSIPIRTAGVQLKETAGGRERPGADLLIRLMLYRNVMRSLGSRFFDRDLDNADLVQRARDAMIVSPVSSLIVLETEEDYKRFGVYKDPSALGASKLAEPGSVPEPAETALALLVTAAVFLFLRQRKMRRITA